METPELIWNIEPLKRKEMPTGEIQIWTECEEKYGPFIVRAVNSHEELVALIQTQIDSMNRAGEHLNYSGIEWKHKAERAIAKAEA